MFLILRSLFFLIPSLILSLLFGILYDRARLDSERRSGWTERFLFFIQGLAYFWLSWHGLLVECIIIDYEVYAGTILIAGYFTLSALIMFIWLTRQPIRPWLKVVHLLLLVGCVLLPLTLLLLRFKG